MMFSLAKSWTFECDGLTRHRALVLLMSHCFVIQSCVMCVNKHVGAVICGTYCKKKCKFIGMSCIITILTLKKIQAFN